ncbi:MAG: PhnD/SsuA/transferrin family substrate-binding protein, partial [Thioalkalispiraceae bacterium]
MWKFTRSVILLIFLGLCPFTVAQAQGKPTIRIGVLAIWGEKLARKMWQPTIDYLNRELPQQRFVMLPLTLAAATTATRNHDIDFIITNPGNYVSLEARFDITRILTLRSRRQGHITTQFSAVIFSRADREDIKSLHDLKNKTFMGVKESAFGGFQMAWHELMQHDVDPFEDFTSLTFSGFPQDTVVYAVRDGKVDAGTVRTGTLERMANLGDIDLADYHIINEQPTKQFPFKHSTTRYPEWPLAKLSHISEELAKQVSIALLSIPQDSEIAKAARSAGWTVPLDYSAVHTLMKDLQVGPYLQATQNKQRLDELQANFWTILAVLIITIPFVVMYIHRLRFNVHRNQVKLEQIENEWSHALDFLDEPMYMVDLNDKLIRANKAFFKKIGSDAEHALGKKVTQFTHPEGEEIPCKVCQARKDMKDTSIVLEADDPVNKAGTPMEISIKVVRNIQGQPIGIIQGMRDLTQSRASEAAIRQSEALFRGLLNTTPDPLVATNQHGMITIVNTQFEKTFGYSRDEIIGQDVEILLPERLRNKHVAHRKSFHIEPFLRPMGANVELVGIHKDGHEIPLDISLSPFEVENETLVIAALHDISERIESERELKRLASYPELDPMPIVEYSMQEQRVTYLNSAARQYFPELEHNSNDHPLLENIDELYNELKSNDNQLIRDIEFHNTIYEQNINLDTETDLIRIYSWDITKLRELSQRMSYQATHDSLTGLPNRREFENQ